MSPIVPPEDFDLQELRRRQETLARGVRREALCAADRFAAELKRRQEGCG